MAAREADLQVRKGRTAALAERSASVPVRDGREPWWASGPVSDRTCRSRSERPVPGWRAAERRAGR